MEIDHKDWVRKCLQSVWGKSSDTDNEIVAYLENMDNHILPDLSISSLSSSNMTSPTDEAAFFSSDMESVSSQGTVQEKHNCEYNEKGYRIEGINPMDTSDDSLCSPVSPSDNALSNPVAQKRSSDTSPSGVRAQDGQPHPPLPHKRRPVSGELAAAHSPDDSIHMPEPGGFSVKELGECCRIKGRKGLYREYAQIKGEPPIGTFDISK